MGTLTPDQLGGLTSMTLHELFTLLILSIGTSGTNQIQYMKYTSEYIPKIQIHQHSLLTRKIFSWHNSSAQVFFSRSSLDHHQHWIITRSSSSLDHYWIITKDVSSLDHHKRWILIGSSLDHHQSWIIIGSSSSLLLLSRSTGSISQFFSS